MITLRELIKHLQTLPQDYFVAYLDRSGYSALEIPLIHIMPKEAKRIAKHRHYPGDLEERYVSEGKKETVTPEFVDAILIGHR